MTKYLKVSEVSAGDTVMLDRSFTCIKTGPALIHKDAEGFLYFKCRQDGYHGLNGQVSRGRYIGLSKVV